MLTEVIPADGAVLERLLSAMHARCNTRLDRDAYGRFHAARMKTAWGCRSLRAFALLDGTDLRAGALRYDFAAVLDGRPIRVCGIGSLFTEPAYRGHASRLIDTLLDDATRDGAGIALLFSRSGDPAFAGFEPIGTSDTAIEIMDTPRPGAPMTLVRGGEIRDLAAIVAMGQIRAAPFRFHLDRDVDLVHYAITAKRLLAGLGPADARHLQFFIAEEGITAAAYVVVTIAGRRWTIEECGDRDPSGARVGALLQALVAREPMERRPTIGGWLPSRFVPPQVTATTRPSTEVMMIRSLNAVPAPRLSGDNVLYWRGDIF